MISTASMLDLIKRATASQTYVRHGYTIHEWDVSGSCQKPVTREILSRPLGLYRTYFYGRGSEKAYSMILHVRCRMCDTCRKLKAAQWTARARSELGNGVRTWFGTLTLSPQSQFEMTNRARSRLRAGGTDFDELSAKEKFDERMTEIGREVTLWLKRVRKNSGAALRYLLVAEAHKSGEPHLHILVTEVDAERPVRYRTLSESWKWGYTKMKLCFDGNSALYLCKYIAKSTMARVRASLRYGKSSETPARPSEASASVIENAPEKGETVSTERTARSETTARPYGASLTDPNGGKKIHGFAINTPGKSPGVSAYGARSVSVRPSGPKADRPSYGPTRPEDEPPF